MRKIISVFSLAVLGIFVTSVNGNLNAAVAIPQWFRPLVQPKQETEKNRTRPQTVQRIDPDLDEQINNQYLLQVQSLDPGAQTSLGETGDQGELGEAQNKAVMPKEPLLQHLDAYVKPLMPGEFYSILRVGGVAGGELPTPSNPLSLHSCPYGTAIVGMTVRAGAVIDQITKIHCQDINELGQGAVQQVQVNEGGGGGGIYEFMAPAGAVFTGFSTKTVDFDYNVVIGRLAPHAHFLQGNALDYSNPAPLSPSSVGNGDWFHQGEADEASLSPASWVPLQCPVNYFLRGVWAVPSAFLVGEMGAVCQRMVPFGYNAFEKDEPGKLSQYTGLEVGPLGSFGPAGGMGGGYFRAECPAGMIVVGIEGRAGAFLDAIKKLRCAWFSKVQKAETDYVPLPVEISGGGGNGGGEFIAMADAGKAFRGFRHRADNTGDWQNTAPIISKIIPRQTHLLSKATVDMATYGQGEGETHQYLTCPIDFIMTGIKGRAGSYLDALGIICRKYRPEINLNFDF